MPGLLKTSIRKLSWLLSIWLQTWDMSLTGSADLVNKENRKNGVDRIYGAFKRLLNKFSSENMDVFHFRISISG